MNSWGNEILNGNEISWLFKRLKKTANVKNSSDRRKTSIGGCIICDLRQSFRKNSMQTPPAPCSLLYYDSAIHFEGRKCDDSRSVHFSLNCFSKLMVQWFENFRIIVYIILPKMSLGFLWQLQWILKNCNVLKLCYLQALN